MKTFAMVLLLIISACNTKETKSAYSLNEDLFNGPWKMNYSFCPSNNGNSCNDLDEILTITGTTASFRNFLENTVNPYNGLDVDMTITPISANSIRATSGSKTIDVSYSISGDDLTLCYPDGSCNTYSR